MSGPFPATIVADPEAQQNWDALTLLLPLGKAQILQAGSGLALAAAGTARRVNWGSGTVSWSAGSITAQLSVPHGLGVAPVVIQTTAAQPAQVVCTIQESAAADATNFYVKGFQSQGATITNTQTFYWVAIG